MRVRMTQLSARPDGVLEADRIYDLPDERARHLITAGAAVAVDQRRPQPTGQGGDGSKPEPAKKTAKRQTKKRAGKAEGGGTG